MAKCDRRLRRANLRPLIAAGRKSARKAAKAEGIAKVGFLEKPKGGESNAGTQPAG